jgi:hypothetical protein
MSVKPKLRNALDAIENARRKLKRLFRDDPTNTDLRRAIRELDDAEYEVSRALREAE